MFSTDTLVHLGATSDYAAAAHELEELLPALTDETLRENATLCNRVAVRGIGAAACPAFQRAALQLGARVLQSGCVHLLGLAVKQADACTAAAPAAFAALAQGIEGHRGDCVRASAAVVGAMGPVYAQSLRAVAEELTKGAGSQHGVGDDDDSGLEASRARFCSAVVHGATTFFVTFYKHAHVSRRRQGKWFQDSIVHLLLFIFRSLRRTEKRLRCCSRRQTMSSSLLTLFTCTLLVLMLKW